MFDSWIIFSALGAVGGSLITWYAMRLEARLKSLEEKREEKREEPRRTNPTSAEIDRNLLINRRDAAIRQLQILRDAGALEMVRYVIELFAPHKITDRVE